MTQGDGGLENYTYRYYLRLQTFQWCRIVAAVEERNLFYFFSADVELYDRHT